MAFWYPHSAGRLLDAMANGIKFDDSTIEFEQAAAMMAANHAAVEDYFSNLVSLQLAGTADGAGAATVAHGIGAGFGLLSAQAWYKGATAADFVACTVDSVDDTNVEVSGAGAAQPVRVLVVYSLVSPSW